MRLCWFLLSFPLLGACRTPVAQNAGQSTFGMIPFESAHFVPADPANPGAGSYAVLSGDPASGPSQMLFRYGPGPGALHKHSADYQAVVLSGQAKHWLEGKTPADVPALGPGSYWSQPADQLHADECLSEECLLFVNWAGKMD